jgi:hypothetical protein
VVSETRILRKMPFLRGGSCDSRAKSECVEIHNYYNRNFKLILLIIICHLLNHDTLIGFDPVILMPLYQSNEEVTRV